jgi:tripartite-type tricarboxylate transporter receptor subunit TctC
MLIWVCASMAVSIFAQPYPHKPIRLIIPFAAGGPRDVQARLIGPKLASALGQSIVVDNRSGANGIIGTELAAKARPDGHTLLMISSGHAVNATLYQKLPYDSIRDFAFTAPLASGPGLLVVQPALPARSVQELVQYLKGRPGKVFYASAGNGAPSHLAVELFKVLTRTEIVHVPYRGMASGITDLIAGQVQLSIPTIPAGLPHAKTGKLRALAVTSMRRSTAAPELPTMIEGGIADYSATNCYGIAAPARTPRSVIARLNNEIRAAISAPDVSERLIAIGLEPVMSDANEFSEFVKTEITKWSKVVKAAGLQPD